MGCLLFLFLEILHSCTGVRSCHSSVAHLMVSTPLVGGERPLLQTPGGLRGECN